MSCLAETALAKAMNCNKHLGKLQLTIIMAIFDPEFLLNIPFVNKKDGVVSLSCEFFIKIDQC